MKSARPTEVNASALDQRRKNTTALRALDLLVLACVTALVVLVVGSVK